MRAAWVAPTPAEWRQAYDDWRQAYPELAARERRLRDAARAAGGRALRSHLGWLTGVASELGHAADEALSLIITLEREGGGL